MKQSSSKNHLRLDRIALGKKFWGVAVSDDDDFGCGGGGGGKEMYRRPWTNREATVVAVAGIWGIGNREQKHIHTMA